MLGPRTVLCCVAVLAALCCVADGGLSSKKVTETPTDCSGCLVAGQTWDLGSGQCLKSSAAPVTGLKMRLATGETGKAGSVKSDCDAATALLEAVNQFSEAKRGDRCFSKGALRPFESKGRGGRGKSGSLIPREIVEAARYAAETVEACETLVKNIADINGVPRYLGSPCQQPSAHPTDQSDYQELLVAAGILQQYVQSGNDVRAFAAEEVPLGNPGGNALSQRIRAALDALKTKRSEAATAKQNALFESRQNTRCETHSVNALARFDRSTKQELDALWAAYKGANTESDAERLLATARRLNEQCQRVSKVFYQHSSGGRTLDNSFWRGCFTYSFHDVKNAEVDKKFETVEAVLRAKLSELEREKFKHNAAAKKNAAVELVRGNWGDYEDMYTAITTFNAQSGADYFNMYRCAQLLYFAADELPLGTSRREFQAKVTKAFKGYFNEARSQGVTLEPQDRDCSSFTSSPNIRQSFPTYFKLGL